MRGVYSHILTDLRKAELETRLRRATNFAAARSAHVAEQGAKRGYRRIAELPDRAATTVHHCRRANLEVMGID